jgi:hypothetical protein
MMIISYNGHQNYSEESNQSFMVEVYQERYGYLFSYEITKVIVDKFSKFKTKMSKCNSKNIEVPISISKIFFEMLYF